MTDLVLFPHCDLHLVLTGASALELRLFLRGDPDPVTGRYPLTPVGASERVIEFFAPHAPLRHRFDDLPTVDTSGVVKATKTGVYLFHVRAGDRYLVGRLQVHRKIENWWFGNDSLTTALDPVVPHSQPSLYARFDDDVASGTDLVGDITGHGYITLSSSDPAKLTVSSQGRVGGSVVTPPPPSPAVVKVLGSFQGGPVKELPVHVVDYARVRADLFPVEAKDAAGAARMQNILFVGEGFTDGEKPGFESAVADAAYNLFEKPRHQPYGILGSRFNMFSYFTPSRENKVTTGFRVTDTASGKVGIGSPIPFNGAASPDEKMYTLVELTARVGLPKRNEQRKLEDLLAEWNGQDLHDFKPAKVDKPLTDAWKAQQAKGILHARDTFFGLNLGQRLGDRVSGESTDHAPRPVNDTAGDPVLRAFLTRVYEFYRPDVTRLLIPDPRRHPPELYRRGAVNIGDPILRFVVALRFTKAGTVYPLGDEWKADTAGFRRSRGLIAMIVNDDLDGGTNFNAKTVTAQTVNSRIKLKFDYQGPGTPGHDELEMRRDSGPVDADLDGVTDTIAHEFGHSFNLGDEYEERGGDNPALPVTAPDSTSDNLAVLPFLRSGAPPSRKLDIDLVKWLILPRMKLAARLLAPSVNVPFGIQVSIGITEVGNWAVLEGTTVSVRLRNFKPGPGGTQLPLAKLAPGLLEDLRVFKVDKAAGTIVLNGPSLPPSPFPVFEEGSALYVPAKDPAGVPLLAVRQETLAFLRSSQEPLNVETGITEVNTGADFPRPIDGGLIPCEPSTLIGIYEGAGRFAGGSYRPAGACKMRDSGGRNEAGEFCFVCKWLIVNRVDPGMHALLSAKYYPGGGND
ncbi:hypothetical protein [Amycolatopsis speibonae]|uniref:EcxA zinc-binding domain-containing protein n=1 Tax=Amycolatopsis speibonae TaxID=1450224 RepID=A0ABV7PDD9_9PSEU